MDKLQLLQERKMKIADASKEIREDVFAIIDEGSFVELSAFSFSKSEFYGADATGEGVLTGYATIDGFAFYIVAQNYKVLDGGMTKANCDKIVKCRTSFGFSITALEISTRLAIPPDSSKG